VTLYSFIIPIFNRPDELRELLQSVAAQTYTQFEVIVVEDGSTIPAEDVIRQFTDAFPLRYYRIANVGTGRARNYGCQQATGEYFLFVDSDCLLPPHYLETVHLALTTSPVDAFGGPDAVPPSFSPMQQAINYTMTSVLTTGGIRGRKRHIGVFYPRGFNMGVARTVYEAMGGFSAMRFGEDVEFSARIIKAGFSTALIEAAFVYHKRRGSWRQFFKQMHNFGIARINLYLRHPETLHLAHFSPALFLLYCLGVGAGLLVSPRVAMWAASGLFGYAVLLFADAAYRTRSVGIGGLSLIAAFVQLVGYGSGFLRAVWWRLICRRGEFAAFQRTFSQ
jgi:glycosyltransferase involved in cell wall biosynthesis